MTDGSLSSSFFYKNPLVSSRIGPFEIFIVILQYLLNICFLSVLPSMKCIEKLFRVFSNYPEAIPRHDEWYPVLGSP